jgi:hypothetical protein
MSKPGGPNKTLIAGGIFAALSGLPALLTALGIIPHAQDPSDPAPAWVIFLMGFVFQCGGVAVVLKGALGDAGDASGALPASAPVLARAAYDLLVITIVCSLAALFTWIAFGPGARHFSVSGDGMSMPASGSGDWMGRAAFGFGAVLTWIIVGAVAVTMMRRWRKRT